jgi:hypothetical protein
MADWNYIYFVIKYFKRKYECSDICELFTFPKTDVTPVAKYLISLITNLKSGILVEFHYLWLLLSTAFLKLIQIAISKLKVLLFFPPYIASELSAQLQCL